MLGRIRRRLLVEVRSGARRPAPPDVCLIGTRLAHSIPVKYFDWDDTKNARLNTERGLGFEDVVFHIESGDLLDVLEHPNEARYADQRIFVVRRDNDVYLAPFVEAERTGVPEDDHSEPQSHEGIPGKGGRTIMKLEPSERDMLESVERGEWRPVRGGKAGRARYVRYATATFRKDRRLNIRLSSRDLEAIQKRALAEGLPYQTLISSLLHKYASGRLREA